MRSLTPLSFDSKVLLNNGTLMPVLGFGTWRLEGSEARTAVGTALRIGYRSIDTASMYMNEVEIGKAVQESDLPREELFITSKLWSHEHGYDEALAACSRSLERLGLEHLDLYLIHWPNGERNVETWQAMIDLLHEGRTRAIGVSNFSMEGMAALIDATGVVPAVDQVEFNPYHFDEQLLEECRRAGIQIEAYSPLKGMDLRDPVLRDIAASRGRSAAQIVLRWCLQKGTVVLVKSSHPDRMVENSEIFDFTLNAEEMQGLDRLG